MARPSFAAVSATFSLFGAGEAHPLEHTDGGCRCCCGRCEKWATFVRTGGPSGGPVYLLLTCELVDGLARWLLHEQQRWIASTSLDGHDQQLCVLEVGAGDGSLALALQEALEALATAPVVPRIVATDSGARGLRPAPSATVLVYDVDAALAAFAPHIVLVSFMPLGHDWTASFRACASLRAYLLLGEVDDGCCGRPWATWGVLCDGDDDAADLEVSSTSGSEEEEEEEEEEVEEEAAEAEAAEAVVVTNRDGSDALGRATPGTSTDGAFAATHTAAPSPPTTLAFDAGSGEAISVPTPQAAICGAAPSSTQQAQGWAHAPSEGGGGEGGDRRTPRERGEPCCSGGDGGDGTRRGTRHGAGHDAEAWRRVYAYEPARTPWGGDGWTRRELGVSAFMVCCTDTCWAARQHAKAVLFARRGVCAQC
jgi:hypothetical protein